LVVIKVITFRGVLAADIKHGSVSVGQIYFGGLTPFDPYR
jgi:hypothetical protein